MILITGATGFIGASLTQYLHQQGNSLTTTVRHVTNSCPRGIQQIPVGDLLPDTNWIPALHNIDIIIHLAARVHIMQDTTTNPLEEFRRANTAGTLNLAQQAAKSGVRRFIFLSSIKVNGEHTEPNEPFIADNNSYTPTDPYAISKYEAEQGLREIAQQTGMEIVIIRPPLVYGAGVKGNFQQLLHWVNKGIPLPLGAIHNQRSLVALDNLINLITLCIDHPAATNQTFLVSDDEDLSTTELLQRMAKALGKPNRLIPVPQKLLTTGLNLLGKQDIAQRLCGNLQMDISKTKQLLGWKPPISVDEALNKTAQAWLAQHS